MANQDKSRQQSSYMPSSGAQQGGGEAQRAESTQVQGGAQRGERSLAPRQGTYLGAGDYGGSPFGLMRRLSEDMDRLFENFGMPSMFSRTPFSNVFQQSGMAMWSPRIEVYEQDNKLVLEAELPGLRKEDVQAQIEDDAVVISGERQYQNQQNQGGRYLSERSYGSFHRVIPLPDGVDPENATANFRDGILRIEMPMVQRQRGRKLTIGEGTTATGSQRSPGSQTSAKPGDEAPTG